MTRLFLFLVFSLFPISALAENVIPAHKSVKLSVGETIVIHGYRGPCGERPGNVDPNRTRATQLGVLSNGKWGVMKSRTCGGMTPAVEILFTAKKKGREVVEIQKTKIRVEVR